MERHDLLLLSLLSLLVHHHGWQGALLPGLFHL